MAILDNFNDETKSAGYNWLNSVSFGGGGGLERMRVEWNQCDGLSLAKYQPEKQCNIFNTREKFVVCLLSVTTHCISTDR
jgi:hypothetical protein